MFALVLQCEFDGSVRLSHLPKITQLVSQKAEPRQTGLSRSDAQSTSQAFLLQRPLPEGVLLKSPSKQRARVKPPPP